MNKKIENLIAELKAELKKKILDTLFPRLI